MRKDREQGKSTDCRERDDRGWCSENNTRKTETSEEVQNDRQDEKSVRLEQKKKKMEEHVVRELRAMKERMECNWME